MQKKILKILEKDPKVTPREIALQLKTKEEKVAKMIKEMEYSKIIRGYRTVINWEKLGEERCYALVDIKVSPARDVGFDDTAERIYKFPEVKFVYLVSGLYDISIMVEGKTMRDIANFVAEKLAPIDRVQSTITHFVMKKYKEEGEIAEERNRKRLPVSF